MLVVDNFLHEEDHNLLVNTMTNNNFPWFFSKEKTADSLNNLNYQFIHIFYKDYGINSDWFFLIKPIIDKLSPDAILRIKANLTVNTGYLYQYDFHNDVNINATTAVYYLNTNNGKTIFKNNESIDSVSNRILLFNSSELHTGTSCTDEKYRLVININYLGGPYEQ